jgi:3-deoxy-D-manno-octulosonic-acid transferase
MMPLYNIGIRAYRSAIGLAMPFNQKARFWVKGRKNWRENLKKAIDSKSEWIWFHCSSLGEFEQGRPLIEAIKAKRPKLKILLTFFSPSGYEIRKNYEVADHVAYLPLDTKKNAQDFLDILNPKLVFFVKYDLWLNFIAETQAKGIPMILISVLLRADSRFLKSNFKSLYKKAFRGFRWIFTQDENSRQLLKSFAECDQISVAGDTRFDRVAQLPKKFVPIPEIEDFIMDRTCIVAGSPWPKDEAVLLPVISKLRRKDLCWIIAPHEIHPAHIDEHIDESEGKMAKFSEIEDKKPETDVLWIDNIGMLSRLYHYASIVYIGGGFGSGIHNTQEAAIYGNPILFGPNYSKFQEAVDMVAAGGALSIKTADELEAGILNWLDDPDRMAETGSQNIAYMNSCTGATNRILEKLDIEKLI